MLKVTIAAALCATVVHSASDDHKEDFPLPDGWVKHLTDDGEPYYEYDAADHVQWELPLHDLMKEKISLPDHLQKYYWKEIESDPDSNGKTSPYYWDVNTDKVQWDEPATYSTLPYAILISGVSDNGANHQYGDPNGIYVRTTIDVMEGVSRAYRTNNDDRFRICYISVNNRAGNPTHYLTFENFKNEDGFGFRWVLRDHHGKRGCPLLRGPVHVPVDGTCDGKVDGKACPWKGTKEEHPAQSGHNPHKRDYPYCRGKFHDQQVPVPTEFRSSNGDVLTLSSAAITADFLADDDITIEGLEQIEQKTKGLERLSGELPQFKEGNNVRFVIRRELARKREALMRRLAGPEGINDMDEKDPDHLIEADEKKVNAELNEEIEGECPICFDDETDLVQLIDLETGKACCTDGKLCRDCAPQVDECPVCRKHIQKVDEIEGGQ